MIEQLRTTREVSTMSYDHRYALDFYFERIARILEDNGHRPFGRLELSIPGQAPEFKVIWHWAATR